MLTTRAIRRNRIKRHAFSIDARDQKSQRSQSAALAISRKRMWIQSPSDVERILTKKYSKHHTHMYAHIVSCTGCALL